MAECRAGNIDVVLVYKIDRLSRSICDFAELTKFFDQYNVSFCSVTQDINTSTSSGRMMLNILMTFAQYEREIIGERIRDKFAASKRKGMWMGGMVLLAIASRTASWWWWTRSTRPCGTSTGATWTCSRPSRSPSSSMPRAARQARRPWDKNKPHHILRNCLYVGKVSHKGEIFEGEHAYHRAPGDLGEAQRFMDANPACDRPDAEV